MYAEYARALKRSVTLTYRVAAHFGNDPHPHPLTPQEAEPQLADASIARDPAGEALILLGSPTVVEQTRTWVVTVMEMEAFLRAQTRDPAAWQALMDRQRAGREGYYRAVREDLALPPGHSARWALTSSGPPPQRYPVTSAGFPASWTSTR